MRWRSIHLSLAYGEATCNSRTSQSKTAEKISHKDVEWIDESRQVGLDVNENEAAREFEAGRSLAILGRPNLGPENLKLARGIGFIVSFNIKEGRHLLFNELVQRQRQRRLLIITGDPTVRVLCERQQGRYPLFRFSSLLVLASSGG